MSALTKCNYCVYEQIKLTAAQAGRVLKRLPEAGGIAVYASNKDGSGEEFVAWFAQLPTKCCC